MRKVEKKISGFVIAGIIISLIITIFISPFASGFPDGLEKVAEKLGFTDKAVTAVNDSFFIIPDYSFKYIKNEVWQGPVAGLFGVMIILILFSVVYLIYKASVKNKKNK